MSEKPKKEAHNYSVKFSLWIDNITVDKEIDLSNDKEKEEIVSYAINELIAEERNLGKYLQPENLVYDQGKKNINFQKPQLKK